MKVELMSDFEFRIQGYLKTITKNNFSRKYEGLQNLIIKYNELGLSKTRILETLNSFHSNSPDDYIEEVVGEIIVCIEGFTSPNKVITLQE